MRGRCFFQSVFLAAREKNDARERKGNVGVEVVLPAPRRAADVKDTVFFENDRFIVVDHGDRIAKRFTPKACVRGLAGATGGTEEIAFAVDTKGRAVHQKTVIVEDLGADVTVNGKVFAVFGREVFVLAYFLLDFFFDILLADFNDKIGVFFGEIVTDLSV